MLSRAVEKPGSQIQIMSATWRDLRELRQVEHASFGHDAWPFLDLVGILTMPGVIRLKATIDGKMVGFIAADIRKSENLAWIATFCVLPEFRRRGIGTALLSECESLLRVPKVRLSVRPSNEPAVHLYVFSGYQKISLWKQYYQDGEDALVMEKQLAGV